MIEYLCDDCKTHFDELKTCLALAKVDYKIDPRIVRGLDYYTRTVFEFVSTSIGAQGTVCGGGRYDGLIETLGGNSIPAVGFAAGIERLLMVQDALNIKNDSNKKDLVYLISLGDAARKANIELAGILRRNKLNVALEVENRSMKAQMRSANNANAAFVVIRGDNELAENCAVIKNMSDGSETKVSIEKIYDSLV
jgi:histidyl-tRNA synthetase